MNKKFLVVLLAGLLSSTMAHRSSAEPAVQFAPSAEKVSCYEYLEVTISTTGSQAKNPFTDVTVEASFSRTGAAPIRVDGFCDSNDGTLFRVRFMPSAPGAHEYTVSYRESGFEKSFQGRFEATDARKRGIVRVDSEFPTHFQWEGTKERFFLEWDYRLLAGGLG
jgi:hypothetical protein